MLFLFLGTWDMNQIGGTANMTRKRVWMIRSDHTSSDLQDHTKVAAKLAELAPLTHMFAKQRRVEMFRNERTRSTLMDTKLMFRGVSGRFVTGQKSMQNRPNWYHYRTSYLNNVASEFFATNAPDPLHLSQNSCFRGISDHFVTARKFIQNLPN
jgi:hypothetical protein